LPSSRQVELADTSAWIWARKPATPDEVRRDFDDRLLHGRIAVCDVVVYELLWETQNPDEFVRRREQLAMQPQCPVNSATWDRAMNVYQALAERGPLHNREVRLNDLLIAAAAEQFGCPLVHYDHHFDTIAAVTGQPTRWLAPRGTL
jgi:predicted nucleic acid-binding protein